MDMIGQQCRYYCCRQKDLRACDKQAATIIIQRCNPPTAQKPAAAEGNTMRVRRHIRVYRSLQFIAEDKQSWGADTCTPTTPHHHDKSGNVVVLAVAAVCDSVAYAYLLSLFAYLCNRPPPSTLSAVRAALPGLLSVLYTVPDMLLPIPFLTLRQMHYYGGVLLLLLQAAAVLQQSV